MIAPVRSCSQRLLVARAPTTATHCHSHILVVVRRMSGRSGLCTGWLAGWTATVGVFFFPTPIAFAVPRHALHSPAVMRRTCVAGFGNKLYAGEVMDPSVIVGQPHKDWKDLHRPQEPRLLVLWFNSGVRKLYVPPHWLKRRFTHTPA